MSVEAPLRTSLPVSSAAPGVVRAMTPMDCGAVANLLSTVFEGVRSADEVRRKYFPSPGEPGLSTVLEADGRIVGFHGLVRQTWRLDGREIVGVMGADLAVSPPYRRLDVFLRMAEEGARVLRENRIQFLWGVPVDEVRDLNRELLDFDVLGEVPRWVCPVRLGRCLAGKRTPNVWSRLLPGLLWPVDLRLVRHRVRRTSEVSLREVDEVDDRYEAFQAACLESRKMTRVRVRDEWNRRFGAGAHPEYHRIVAEDRRNGGLRGLLVLAEAPRHREGIRRGRILEFVVRPGVDPEAERQLLAHALGEARRRGWDALDVWLSPGDPSLDGFRRRGFRYGGKPTREIHVKSLFPSPLSPRELPGSLSSWQWSIGHGDEL